MLCCQVTIVTQILSELRRAWFVDRVDDDIIINEMMKLLFPLVIGLSHREMI